LGNRRRKRIATHGLFRATHGESRYHPKIAGWTGCEDAQHRAAVALCHLLRKREFSYRPCKNIPVRFIVAVVAALIGVGVLMPPTAAAGPTVCD
jgi:hypothetical protein